MRRISPVCPKCQSQITYDVIPELPNSPDIQLSNELEEVQTYPKQNRPI
jgi:hypothetical protein